MRALLGCCLLVSCFRVESQSEFLVQKGDNLEDVTDNFLRATPILQGDDIQAFREAIRSKIILEGVVVQWQIVVCLCSDPDEFRRQLVSSLLTYPDADKIVLLANGFSPGQGQIATLRSAVPGTSAVSIQLETTSHQLSPEQALAVVWDVLPLGAKVVAFCIRECEETAWPLAAPFTPASRGTDFLHYTRVMWSYHEKFEGPLVALVPRENSCFGKQEGGMKYCPHPSLIMFDTETVNRLGLPSENGDGIGTWIEAAMDLSKIYVGSRGDFQEVDEYSDISTITPLSGITFPPSNNTRIDVLVVLAGPIDTMTAPIFGDIANTVQDGLRTLGHPSRVIYCSNLATDGCFAQGQQLIVLAAHNLASYFTSEGALAVLEMNLLPPEAVLYNFEHIPRHVPLAPPTEQPRARDRSLVSNHTLEIYRSYTLWEYSHHNVDNLLAMGISSELVPLGFGSRLASSGSMRTRPNGDRGEEEPQNEYEFIDVLFVGTETPTRRATIRRLRDAGIAVVYPNSAGLKPFGAELDAIAAQSKIVLSLNAFGTTVGEHGATPDCNNGEWKIARLIRLLASSRFVVAEMSGSASEREALSGGVVFTTLENLVETCLYYLERPDERTAIAERGRRLIEQQQEADILRKPIQNMMSKYRDDP